jgi:hypothetical protein
MIDFDSFPSFVCRYIHNENAASMNVLYRSTAKRNMPFLTMTSLSPGWCSTSKQRTTCFGALPVDNCAIQLPDNATAGEVIDQWEVSFTIKSPLAVGPYIDIGLPGFESPSHDQITVFSFDVSAKHVDPEFPPKLPEPQPEYELLNCYEDVRIKRAVGGGTCGNFRDANAIVTSVHACARLAAEKEYAGFCIADNSTCMTSRDFMLEYDTYNVSLQLDDIEEAERAEFVKQLQLEKSECLNATKRATLDAGGVYNASEAAKKCTPTREFVFNTTGLRGCLRDMGGPEAMRFESYMNTHMNTK